MIYITDNMFNGLAKELPKAGIECETANQLIWGDNDSSKKGRYDAEIFRFLLEKKYKVVPLESPDEDYTIITADKDLVRYCREFDIDCEYIAQDKPPTKAESKELAAMLIAKFSTNSM